MKQFKTHLLLAIITLFSTQPLLAKAINKDKIVGTWKISAEISADVPYKHWEGTIAVTRSGNNLSGVLNWSNAETGWHVKENMAISEDIILTV